MPSISLITSPGARPARSAGPPITGAITIRLGSIPLLISKPTSSPTPVTAPLVPVCHIQISKCFLPLPLCCQQIFFVRKWFIGHRPHEHRWEEKKISWSKITNTMTCFSFLTIIFGNYSTIALRLQIPYQKNLEYNCFLIIHFIKYCTCSCFKLLSLTQIIVSRKNQQSRNKPSQCSHHRKKENKNIYCR